MSAVRKTTSGRNRVASENVIAYDTETTGFSPYKGCKMFSYSTSTPEGEIEVRRLDGRALRQTRNRKALERLWSNGNQKQAKSMHNCLNGCAPIRLADGTVMTLQRIVNNRLPVTVLSYNFETKRIEPKRVTNWFKGGLTDFNKFAHHTWLGCGSDKWIKLAFEHKSESQVCLYATPNHMIFRPGGGKVKATNLVRGNYVLLHEPHLTGVFRDFAAGTLLGDGTFYYQNGSRNCGIGFSHSEKQRSYFNYKCEILADFIGDVRETPNNHERSFNKRKGALLLSASLRHSFQLEKVRQILGEHKECPSKILETVGPAALAIWYMDDGCALRSYSNQGICGAQICCCSIPRAEQNKISKTLEKRFGIRFHISPKQKPTNPLQRSVLVIGKRSGADLFFEMIASYIPPSMQYKLPTGFRGRFKMPEHSADPVVPVRITRKRVVERLPRSYSKTRYDIEVADNHNFFASNILVSNCKFDLAFTEDFLGRKLDGHAVHDTSIMSHILQNWHPHHRLKDLAWELAGYPKQDESAVKLYAAGHDYSTVPEPVMDEYQHGDAERQILLHLFFYPKILENPAYGEIYEMELQLVWTTMRMEERGIMIDQKRCNDLVNELRIGMDQIVDELEHRVGWAVSPSKPSHVIKLLFHDLGLPVLARTPTTREPRTRKEDLLALREHVEDTAMLDLIIKYRSYQKGAANIAGYLDCADEDGIIHPSIHTNGARTGRESCSDPNLQNVAKSGTLQNLFPIPARRCFRPRPGYVNLHVDYAGIEMRLLVHYSGDMKMIEIFQRGADPHAHAAEIFYGKKFTDTQGARKKSMRDAAKNYNFAIPYGAGWRKAAPTLGISEEEGRQAYARYAAEHPRLVNLNKEIGREVRRDGYVETEFGRRLYLPKQKPYVGTNYRVQGTAAGILKRAQNRVHPFLEEATGGEVRMLLPIHDELIIEIPRSRLKDARDILPGIRERMIAFPQFKVPMEVEFEVSTRDWENLKEIRIQ